MNQETIDRLRNIDIKSLRKITRGCGLYSRNPKYWINAGFNRDDSLILSKSRMPGTYEYFLIYKKQNNEDAIKNATEAKKQTAVTLKNMITRYGETEGKIRFESYCEKQRYKNTYISKKEKYGWDKATFDEFNKSRSVTISNMIRKHGVNDGYRKYNDYCEKQKNTKSLDYLISKHGEIEGIKKFNEINALKSHSLQSYIIRNNGDIIVAREKYNHFWKNKNVSYSSESSTVFFRNLVIYCGLDITQCYYADSIHNKKEYGINLGERYIFVDFFYNNKVIEFNGDYWHANPKYFNASDVIKYPNGSKKVADIWECDKSRREKIMETRKFVVMDIWQNDVIEKPEECLMICKEFLLRKEP